MHGVAATVVPSRRSVSASAPRVADRGPDAEPALVSRGRRGRHARPCVRQRAREGLAEPLPARAARVRGVRVLVACARGERRRQIALREKPG